MTHTPYHQLDPRVRHPWLIHLWNEAHNGKAPNILIVAKRRKGKSWCTLSIGELLNWKTFKPSNLKRDIPEFSKFLANHKNPDLTDGVVTGIDDAGVGVAARDWNTKAHKKFDAILQTWGDLHPIVIFNCPANSLVDTHARNLFDWVLEPVMMNRRRGIVKCKLLGIQWNNQLNKPYYHVFKYNGKRYPTITLPKPSKACTDEYERVSAIWKKKLRKETDESFEEEAEIKKNNPLNVDIEALAKKVLKNPEKYVKITPNRRYVNAALLQVEFSIGRRNADKLKAIVEQRLSTPPNRVRGLRELGSSASDDNDVKEVIKNE